MEKSRHIFTRSGNEGFTLPEVMIAVCVLAIGILAVASMQVTAGKGNSDAIKITETTAMAQNIMEELLDLPYEDPFLQDIDGNGGAGLRRPLPPLPAQAIPDPDAFPSDYQIDVGDFTVHWNISEDDPLPNTKRITVTVTDQGRGVRKATQITSAVSIW